MLSHFYCTVRDILISQGFISHKHAYLRSGWNIVDFIILLLSWMDLSRLLSGSQEKVFRLARALRPLRLIKRNKGLRVLSEVIIPVFLISKSLHVITSWLLMIESTTLYDDSCLKKGAGFT